MKKIYALFYVLLLLISLNQAAAQVVANDNIHTALINGSYAHNTFINVFTNDMVNGAVASMNNSSVTTVSSPYAGLFLTNTYLTTPAAIPPGTYTLEYQICSDNNPTQCDTATLTVTICSIGRPSVVLPHCSEPLTSLTLTNLPPTGAWVVKQVYNNATTNINGSGDTFIVNNLTPGNYTFSVVQNGCTSQSTYTSAGYPNGLSAAISGTYSDFNNNAQIDIGDQILSVITLTNLFDCTLINMQIMQPTNLTSPLPNVLNPGQTVTVTAMRYITQYDINNGVAIQYLEAKGYNNGLSNYAESSTYVPLYITNGITLQSFIDTNSNGILDGAEQTENLGKFVVEVNDDGNPDHLYTGDGTVNLFETNPVNSYDVTLDLHDYTCAAQSSVTPLSFQNITVPTNSGFTTFNFAVQSMACTDVGINLHATNPVPGMTYTNYIHYTNYGLQPASGTITFENSSGFSISNISVPATTTATGFTFNFSNLLPMESRIISVSFAVPPLPNVALGDIVTTSVYVNSTDNYLFNNSATIHNPIVGAYDPNDKAEMNGPEILHSAFSANDYLTYTIRFENTGTANATTVSVTDLLDAKLDEGSIRMVYATHDYILNRNGSQLSWDFADIQLPPSVDNSNIGKGMIVYQIKPKPGYMVDDIILNTASIYFDTNPAIITNTTSTKFVSTLGITENTQSRLMVYPNPTTDILNINTNNQQITQVSVVDISGKTVSTNHFNSTQTSINIGHLSSGVYFIKVIATDEVQTFKIVKK